jgi:two-component system, OmpR family, KDP operon response regulator KdpE
MPVCAVARTSSRSCMAPQRGLAGDNMNHVHGGMDSPKLLVVEDDKNVRQFLRVPLTREGYRVIESRTGREALQQVLDQKPNLLLLDLGLPDIDGLDVIRLVRSGSNLPIIVLSARARESDKVKALDLGADDYLTKPFTVGELLARLRVAARHAAEAKNGHVESTFVLDTLRVERDRRRVFVGGTEVHLTSIEYQILATLIKVAGCVVTHRQLLTQVWGSENAMERQYLRVYMTYLRRKIEPDPARPRFLLTQPGIGYRLASPTPGLQS